MSDVTNEDSVREDRVHAGRVTDAELARVRSLIGKRVEIKDPPYLTEVTRDAVRHWAWAIGDRNPLYLDEAYAKASRHEGLIAPPTMLYAFSRLDRLSRACPRTRCSAAPLALAAPANGRCDHAGRCSRT
jgi:hypothetical protein